MNPGAASLQTVSAALGHALRGVGYTGTAVVVDRQENVYESTNRSEVLTCRVGEHALPPILAKYGPSHHRDHLGLRHGLAYEAEVYREVLAGFQAPPKFFGSHDDRAHGLTWLFLEYLDEGWQLDLGPETAIVDAAAMLGDLHRRAAEATSERTLSRLNHYDEPYFQRCLRQAETQVGRWPEPVPSFARLVSQFARAIPDLAAAPVTVVHGEFTPHNVVWAHEHPRTVDWEQAAVGPGEIDLAALTDEWPPELADPAIAAYLSARWPGSPTYDFAAALQAARLYWLFRWLGDPEQAGTEEEIAWLSARAAEATTS